MKRRQDGLALVEWLTALILVTFGFLTMMDAARLAYCQFDLEFGARSIAREAAARPDIPSGEWVETVLEGVQNRWSGRVEGAARIERIKTIPEPDDRRRKKRIEILILEVRESIAPIAVFSRLLPAWRLKAEARSFRVGGE